MKISFRKIGVSSALVAIGMIAGLGVLRGMDRAARLSPTDPQYREVMCGPISLHLALGRLGISNSPSQLAANCQVTRQGVSMADLRRAAGRFDGVRAESKRIDWNELVAIDGTAVLFVNHDHYVAVDPRELPSGSPTSERTHVRIYEPGLPGQLWTREKLSATWSGETLIIHRNTGAVTASTKSRIQWQESFLDRGVLERGTPSTNFQFTFRNTGSEPLEIGDVEVSCSCLSYNLSKKLVAPGESAIMDVAMNLTNAEGYLEQHLLVATNDAETPDSMLQVSCGVPRARIVSSDVLRIKDVPQSGEISEEFYVGDPRFSGMTIAEAKFVFENPALADRLKCEIDYQPLGPAAQDLGRSAGFKARPTDYVVHLKLSADGTCPIGTLRGMINLVLKTESGESVQQVGIDGLIVPDIQSIPKVALVSLDATGNGRAAFQLKSHSQRKITVKRSWMESPETLELMPADGAINNEFVVTAKMTDVAVGSPPHETFAFFELNDGTVVSVPVVIYLPPRKS